MRKVKEKAIEELKLCWKRKEGIVHNSNHKSSLYHVINCFSCFYIAAEKNLLSMSAKRQIELEKLQEIITLLTLNLRERGKQIQRLNQSLKGKS